MSVQDRTPGMTDAVAVPPLVRTSLGMRDIYHAVSDRVDREEDELRPQFTAEQWESVQRLIDSHIQLQEAIYCKRAAELRRHFPSMAMALAVVEHHLEDQALTNVGTCCADGLMPLG